MKLSPMMLVCDYLPRGTSSRQADNFEPEVKMNQGETHEPRKVEVL